jgi:hypothetical protein
LILRLRCQHHVLFQLTDFALALFVWSSLRNTAPAAAQLSLENGSTVRASVRVGYFCWIRKEKQLCRNLAVLGRGQKFDHFCECLEHLHLVHSHMIDSASGHRTSVGMKPKSIGMLSYRRYQLPAFNVSRFALLVM